MTDHRDDKPQLDKFRDLARELEADEDESVFEEQVKRVAKDSSPKRAKDKS